MDESTDDVPTIQTEFTDPNNVGDENRLQESPVVPEEDCSTKNVSPDLDLDESVTEFKTPTIEKLPNPSASKSPKTKRSVKFPQLESENSIEPESEHKPTKKTKESPENSQKQANVPYNEPEWSGLPDVEEEYSFDVLKNGSIIDSVALTGKAYFVFGRLQSCDVQLEHPSLSRYHAIVQYSGMSTPTHEKGWYVYDLDSTHGTWVNKKRLSPKVYHRLRVGYVIKFGGSSRLHILQGPQHDQEDESEVTVTEMKEQKEKQAREAAYLKGIELQQKQQRLEAERKLMEDTACGWGMGDDAEEIEGENPYASLVAENESLYIEDPKKALKGYYEREGCDLPDYQFTDVSMGKHKCRVELPVDGPNGEELVAEAVVTGKKKDAVIACALEACRLLDRMGMLRTSKHESRKRKQKNWEDDDYYDSDEDTFLDRTGTIEKKRVMRMKKAGKDEAETYESLMEKYTKVKNNIQDIEAKLAKAKAESEAIANEEMDELDAYMISIKSGVMDTKTRMQLKGDLLRLKAEEQKLHRLVNIAKPASLPPLQPKNTTSKATLEILQRKMHQLQQQKQQPKKPPVSEKSTLETKPDNYEEEEDDDEEEEMNVKHVSKQMEVADVPHIKDKDQINESSKDGHKKTPILPTHPAIGTSSEKHQGKTKTATHKGPKRPADFEKQQVIEKKESTHANQFSTSSVLDILGQKGEIASKSGMGKTNTNFDESDPDYTTWLPPTGQTGDGRTSLNDKLGY